MQFYEKLIFVKFNSNDQPDAGPGTPGGPFPDQPLPAPAAGDFHATANTLNPCPPYFARRCTTEYQRQALSQMLGIRQAFTMKRAVIRNSLLLALRGLLMRSGRFMQTFESLAIESRPEHSSVHPESFKCGKMWSYYGTDGKRAAAGPLPASAYPGKPCDLYIPSEGSG